MWKGNNEKEGNEQERKEEEEHDEATTLVFLHPSCFTTR